MEREDAQELRHSQSASVKARFKVFAEGDDLGRGHSRHGDWRVRVVVVVRVQVVDWLASFVDVHYTRSHAHPLAVFVSNPNIDTRHILLQHLRT